MQEGFEDSSIAKWNGKGSYGVRNIVVVVEMIGAGSSWRARMIEDKRVSCNRWYTVPMPNPNHYYLTTILPREAPENM